MRSKDVILTLEELTHDYKALLEENERLRKENDELKKKDRKTNWERIKETSLRGMAYAVAHVYKTVAPADLIKWLGEYEGFDDTWFGAEP